MQKIIGKVVEVSLGHQDDEYCMHQRTMLEAELEGFKGDRHFSISREAWAGDDKQPEGTIRRNERQWSAMSVEECAEITKQMDLKQSLTAANLSVNLLVEGIPHFSLLPKGSIIKFPSGAELVVEEYNPPCIGMGKKLANTLTTKSGAPLKPASFTKVAAFTRGLVGVIDVAGEIGVGDEITVLVYQTPRWQAKISPYL